MTNEEAIKKLEGFKNYLCSGNPIWDTNEVAEVFDTAIEALRKDVPDTNVGDMVSRQAAIDALGEEPPVWYDGEDELAERNQWRRDVNAIKALPPAQPFFDKDKVSDLLYRIYSICSPHTSVTDIIARNYYFKELGKELFGDDIPVWMEVEHE